MPIENEIKYVLKIDCEPTIAHACNIKLDIWQGYVFSNSSMTFRVRKSTNGEITYHSTFKLKGKQTTEIETVISQRDFNSLWQDSKNKLNKIRYKKMIREEEWSIDFFKSENSVYFVLAEVEMSEESTEPSYMPNFVKENILFQVPLTDNRFSSKKLSRPKYANKLYKEICNASLRSQLSSC